MITDGFGNVITGGNNGGKSSINYKPYGEINRTDSSGPDITKFKYTGQEEDKESGLLYYKARYYDPAIGRFLQADSVVMPENLYGMNRYMYVDGNPVAFNDPDGHKKYETKIQQLGVLFMTSAVFADPNNSGLDENKDAAMAKAWFLGMTAHNKGEYTIETALKDIGKGFQRGAHDFKAIADRVGLTKRVESTMRAFNKGAQSTLRWASGGLENAAKVVNEFTFGKNHNKNIIEHKLGNSDLGRMITRNRACIDLAVDIVSFFLPGGQEKGIAAAIRAIDDFEDMVQVAKADRIARRFSQTRSVLSASSNLKEGRCDLRVD
jgi:RHS repeat-associated protein